MLKLNEQGMKIDAVMLAEALQNKGVLDEIGGMLYLTELARSVPSADNAVSYAHIVRDRATMRQLLLAVTDIRSDTLNPDGKDASDLVEAAGQAISAIADGRPKQGGLLAVDDVLKGTLDKIDDMFQSEGGITGVGTGFEVLDDMTSGWQESD